MILVKYRETDTIEGVVENEQEFNQWLEKHNKQRTDDGHEPEKEFEFDRIPVMRLE